MILLYAAINLFIDDHWSLGSFFFSLAVHFRILSCMDDTKLPKMQVSIKMNVLLYAPALLLVYLTVLGIPHTFVCSSSLLQIIANPRHCKSSSLQIIANPRSSPHLCSVEHLRWSAGKYFT